MDEKVGEFGVLLERTRPFMAAAAPYADCRIALFGVPMDFTASFRPGSRLGPREVREVSYVLEEYSLNLGRALDEVRVCDLGDLELAPGNVEEALDKTRFLARQVVGDGKAPLVLGGEHLVTLPVVEALAETCRDLVVIQFDAHADLRDDYLGQRHSHATVMRRVSELLGRGNVCQLGIRSATREEHQYARANTRFFPGPFPGEGAAAGTLESSRLLRQELAGRPVYITVDIDVLDPSQAPGTGTPEPGGWDVAGLLGCLHALRGLKVVGMDLVEVAPARDTAALAAVAAARIIRDSLLMFW